MWYFDMNCAFLETKQIHRVSASVLCVIAVGLGACHKGAGEAPKDSPQLTPKVTMRNVTFFSKALQRDMPYRVVMPSGDISERKLKTVYLLHGGGGGFRDWTNYSDVAKYAEQGLILVMPEGNSSYYANAAERPQDRYEDYIVKDLIEDVESRFPAMRSREGRAIAGVSMGGYGAINLALHNPQLYAFASGISAALDVPSRPFSIKRLDQWHRFRGIFGPWEGAVQKSNDPFQLVRSAIAENAPYFFLTCGEQEGLLGPNRQFASLLEARHFPYEFHTTPGDHNWKQWDKWLPELFRSLGEHLKAAPKKA
jgi:putative tributyrin esterase